MKAGAIGEEALRDMLEVRKEASLEWPLTPLSLVVPFMIVSIRWTMVECWYYNDNRAGCWRTQGVLASFTNMARKGEGKGRRPKSAGCATRINAVDGVA